MSKKENSLSKIAVSLETYHCESDEEVVQTLKARDYKDPQCVIEIEKEVEVRKYEVDKDRLIECLQSHRIMSIREIAEKLNKPITLIEHWFRRDKCFAIPDPDVWFELKAMLGIETDEFDKAITTFETKPGSYDMANRIYMGDTAPTLTASSENNLYAIEGNGSRDSHRGDGYKEGDTMYTLNTVEQHCVAYKKTSHPKSPEDGQGWAETDVNDTLNAFDQGETRTPTLVAQVYDGSRRHDYQPFGDVGETVQAQYGTGGNNTPIVVENAQTIFGQEVAGTLVSSMTTPVGSTQDKNVIVTETYQKTTGALCASGYDKLGTQEATNDMYVVQSSWDGSQTSPTLTANNAGGEQRMPDKDNFNAVISYGVDCYNQTQTEEQSKSLNSAATDSDHVPCQYTSNSVVRRLTPKECERLQGFPDDWTNIGEWTDSKGKKHKDADSPRYKALGNSIALPSWAWLAGRIVKELGKENPTMASLFDGIGGFPLVFSRAGCEPVWASEIEEFPIAVTKIRFPEEGEENGK